MTGRAVKGESGIGLDCIGDILEEKIGGVRMVLRKAPCPLDPLRELHATQLATKLD